jgi:serine O-acetyltransferase
MITSLSFSELIDYTSRQLNHFFPDKETIDLNEYKNCVQLSLDRLDYCYKKVSLKHYFNGTDTLFNHLYSDQYVMYLWYLANSIWKETQDKSICNKLYYLNKSLHGLDCMYDTKLPDIFLIFHGVGTMLGKATYSDFFVVLQGCTVGMNRGKYPVMGKGVALTAHSSLIGNCTTGDLITVSSYTNVLDEDIATGTVIFKTNDGSIQKKASINSYAQTFFNCPIV